MDHAAALGDAAHAAGFAADGEFHGDLLGNGVGGHNGLGRRIAAVVAKTGGESIHTVSNGLEVQRLTDHTGGSYHHIICCHTGGLFH